MATNLFTALGRQTLVIGLLRYEGKQATHTTDRVGAANGGEER